MTRTALTSVFAVVEVALLGSVEPYETEVILVTCKRGMRFFRPDLVKVSWTEMFPSDIFWPTAEVVGRFARGNSGSFETGGTGKIKFDGEHDEDIDAWPTYVQEAIWAARKAVRLP